MMMKTLARTKQNSRFNDLKMRRSTRTDLRMAQYKNNKIDNHNNKSKTKCNDHSDVSLKYM